MALVKPTCIESQHQTREFLEEVAQCQAELDEVVNGFEKGDLMRDRVDGAFQAKLKAIEAQIADNNNGRQKIRSAIVSCREIAKLSPAMKVSPVIRKEVQQLKKKMKEEMEQAKILLNCVAPPAQTEV